MNTFDKLIGIVLIVVIAALICTIVYLSLVPNPKDRFTEFYILNTDGKAYNYPGNATAGVPLEVIIGIANHERKSLDYTVKIVADRQELKVIKFGKLVDGDKREEKISFIPLSAGKDSKIQFFLFTDAGAEPHLKHPLVLVLDVE